MPLRYFSLWAICWKYGAPKHYLFPINPISIMQRVPSTGWSMVSALFLWVGNYRSSLRRFFMYSTPLLLKRYTFLIFASFKPCSGFSLGRNTLLCLAAILLLWLWALTYDCKNTAIPVAKVRTTCCTYEQLNSLWNCLVVRNFTNNSKKDFKNNSGHLRTVQSTYAGLGHLRTAL